MSQIEISSREFAAEPLPVKQLVGTDVVVVTNRGRPELVILPYERYRALAAALPATALEALGSEDAGDIELEIPRFADHPGPAPF